MIKTPVLITLLRIIFIPISIGLFYLEYKYSNILLIIIFICAAISDGLDGFIARKYKGISKFGIFLDPVADKLIIITFLILLVDKYNSIFITIPTIFIVIREISVSSLREWLNKYEINLAVSKIAKVKTTFQFLAIIVLLYKGDIFGVDTFVVGLVFLYMAVILTLYSFCLYFKTAIKTFHN